MALDKKSREATLSGRNIYKDNLNRYVYYNSRKRIGYVITDDKMGKYSTLNFRYFLGFVAAVLLYTLDWGLNIFLCVGIGIAIILLMEYTFRMKFLPSCIQIMDFEPQHKFTRIQMMSQETVGRQWMKVALFIAFAILFVLNAYDQKFSQIMLIVSYGVSAAGLVMAGIQVASIMYKRNNPDFTTDTGPRKGRKAEKLAEQKKKK